MHETPADLSTLQALLDGSYAAAGAHLLSIHTPDRRLDAAQVAERLDGMCLLVLATVTADGRPIGGPVDGIFYRGSFHFGSGPDSIRFRHIRARPWVTATHLPREELAVTVHGRAVLLDHSGARERRLQADAARRLRPAIRPGVGGVPRLGARLRADRGRADLRDRDRDVTRAPVRAERRTLTS